MSKFKERLESGDPVALAWIIGGALLFAGLMALPLLAFLRPDPPMPKPLPEVIVVPATPPSAASPPAATKPAVPKTPAYEPPGLGWTAESVRRHWGDWTWEYPTTSSKNPDHLDWRAHYASFPWAEIAMTGRAENVYVIATYVEVDLQLDTAARASAKISLAVKNACDVNNLETDELANWVNQCCHAYGQDPEKNSRFTIDRAGYRTIMAILTGDHGPIMMLAVKRTP